MASWSSGCTVLVVSDGLEPLSGEVQVDGKVRHLRIWCRAVPVFLVRLYRNGVTSSDGPHRFSPLLHEPTPLNDEQQLRRSMDVPIRPAAGLEVDKIYDDRRRALDTGCDGEPPHTGAPDEIPRSGRLERHFRR